MKLLIKLGGTLLDAPESRARLASEIAALRHRVVVVHGGGKQMTRYLAERNVESRFVNGLRVTTPEVVDAVLKVFARFPKVPLSREKLMEMARGREYEAFDRSLDVQISRLRKLIEPDPSKPRFIQTVWGLGYVFIPDGTA